MNTVSIEKITYSNFGRCLRLSNGKIEAVVTLDVGPRIIRFGFVGGENFLLEDTERNTSDGGEVIQAVFGENSKWYLYGGHRMWLSPEDMPLSYYPDNEPVLWKKLDDGVELIPPVQKVNNVQYRFEIIMHKDKPKLSVKHYVTNIGATTKCNSIWGLTVLSRGGLEIVPQPTYDTGLLPNRALSVWPYTDMSDERVYWGKKYITLKQDENISSAIKFGINNDRGWAAYLNHNGMFINKYSSNPKGKYPDFGSSFETYTNNFILEMESLGELADITPGSTLFHAEDWELVENVERPDPKDEITIDTLVKLYIEK